MMQMIVSGLMGVAVMLALQRTADADTIGASRDAISTRAVGDREKTHMSLPFDASATAPSGEPDTKALAAAVNEDFARATAAELAAATFVFGELTRLVDISFTRSHQVFLWGMANGEPDAATGLLIVLVRDDAMNVLKSITFGAVRSDGDFTGVRFPELEQAKNADPARGISFFALLGIGTTWEDLAPDPLSLILLGLGTGTVGLLICGRQWQRERRYYRRRYHQLVR